MFHRTSLVVAMALALSGISPVRCQQLEVLPYGARDVVDGIAAIVGDSIILFTQVDDRILRLRAGGVEIPADPEELNALRQDVLTSLVNEQLILQAALADSTIEVNEERLEEVVAEEMDQRLGSFSSQDEMLRALSRQGLTPTSFRELIRNERRRQQLQEQYIARNATTARARAIPVEEEELRQVYEAEKGRLGSRPASISFRQVLVSPEPSDSAREAARSEAEDILNSIREGEEFEDLARRFSDDPGSRQLGGDLGWFRRGVMVDEFEDVAFSLPEGQVSDVVETEFGFHIIQLERARGAERKARHILIQPEVSAAQVELARQRAQDVYRRAQDGEDFESLIQEYGDPEQANPAPVPVDRLASALPPSYAPALRGAGEGDIVGPLEFAGPRGSMFGIAEVLELREAGEVTFEDLRGQIRELLQQQKLVEQLVAELREKSYVELRM
jgi:peptidyl-prolyl cis-trans isomerase SurA